jgi:glycosyltransferase involved in cell wall biosynthesis
MQPTVSVIIPIYCVENYIERCVRSLFKQSLTDVEYIFVNDATPDNSMNILNMLLTEFKDYASRIKIINNPINRGLSCVRNSGLEVASGQYVIFADSDDWVEPDMYETMYEKAISDNADIVWCDFMVHQMVHNQERMFYTSQEVEDISKQSIIKDLLTAKLLGYTWNKLVKKSLYADNQIQYLEGTSRWEDLNVAIQLYYHANQISYVNRALYHYNQSNAHSLVRHFDINRATDDQVKNANAIIKFLKNETHDFFEELIYLKVDSKAPLAYSNRLIDISKWRSIFPEINKQILSNRYLSSQRKFRFALIWLHIPYLFPPSAQSFCLRVIGKAKSWIH